MDEPKGKPGRKKRDPSRWQAGRGDARKTMSEAGWPRDVRFRGHTLRAKVLHQFLWDAARSEMRQILPGHWNPRILAAEVGDSTPGQIIEALNQLANDGPIPLVAFLTDGRIEVLGVRSIHRALEAWKDEDQEIGGKRIETYPIESKRNESTVDVTLQDGTGRDVPGPECKSPFVDGTGRDVTLPEKTEKTTVTGPKPATSTTGSQIPARNPKGYGPPAPYYAQPELKEGRDEYERITKAWEWEHFDNGAWLRGQVQAMLHEFERAQLMLAHAMDVDADGKLTNKPAALLARLKHAQYPPSDESMKAAKDILNAGDVPLSTMIGKE